MFWRRRSRAHSDEPLSLGGKDFLKPVAVNSGICILGAPGSGKTLVGLSALAKWLLALKSRPSFCICPAKASDKAQWMRWCHRAGRERDFVVFGPGQTFNWMEDAIRGPGGVEAAVPLLEAVQQIQTRNQPNSSDAFFHLQSLHRAVEVVRACWLGNGTVCPRDCQRFLDNAPATEEALHAEGFAADTIRRLAKVPGDDADQCLDYHAVSWLNTRLSEKTAASIDAGTSMLFRSFLTGIVGQMLGGPTSTFAPEQLERGMALYIDAPVLARGLPHRTAQAVMMMCVNRYALARDGGRQIVVVADEHAQTVLQGEDAMIAATGRSHNLGRIYIAQNLPQYASSLGGGDKGRQEAQALLGCMGTVLLFANGCRETNQHFSDVLGNEPQMLFGGSVDTGGEPFDFAGHMLGTWEPKAHCSFNQNLQPVLPPQTFLTLETPTANRLAAEAIVIVANRTFADGKSHKKVSFKQVF